MIVILFMYVERILLNNIVGIIYTLKSVAENLTLEHTHVRTICRLRKLTICTYVCTNLSYYFFIKKKKLKKKTQKLQFIFDLLNQLHTVLHIKKYHPISIIKYLC